MKPTPLQEAIRADHERTGRLLSRYREAWLDGDYLLARARFDEFRQAVARHLAWEEDALVQPLRWRISHVHQHHVLQRDADRHRLVRDALDGIDVLMPAFVRPDRSLAFRIVEFVGVLEELLDFHRMLFEDQLVAELDGLLSSDEEQSVATALSRPAPAGCN